MYVRAITRTAILLACLALLAIFMCGAAYAKGYVYLTTLDGRLYDYDANNYSLMASLSADRYTDMTASPDGGWVYLAGQNDIHVINTTNNSREKTIPYDRSDTIEDVIAGDNGRIYVATGSRYIKAYDADTCEPVSGAAKFLAANPYKLELSPDYSRLYVAACRGAASTTIHYLNDYNLSVYDTARLDHVNTRRINMTIEGIAASPDGASLYVLGHNSSTGSKTTRVMKLRAGDLATEKTAYGSGVLPEDIVVSPDGSHVYVSERDKGDILVFNGDTLALERTVAAGEAPMDMAISPNGKKLYIATDAQELRVLDTGTFNINRIPVESEAEPIDISYVNAGSNITLFHIVDLNLTFMTPTPSPTVVASLSGSPTATPMPTMAPTSAIPEPTNPGVTASPEASPADISVTPPPDVSPGVTSTASASPVNVSTPGFYGLAALSGIALAARALMGRGRSKK